MQDNITRRLIMYMNNLKAQTDSHKTHTYT